MHKNWKIIVNRILLFLFMVAQLYFVVAIIKEKNIHSCFLFGFSLVVLAMVLSYRKKDKLHIQPADDIQYELFLFFLIGSFSTYFLQHDLKFNTVFSAGLVGFVGSFTSKSNFKSAKSWPITIYCGAFVGMTNLEFGYAFLLTATFFTAVFYTFTQHNFHGIGGKLGTLAFMGVLYSYLIFKILS